jgi:hypothetical protein
VDRWQNRSTRRLLRLKDIESRDQSHAWIALLEGDVHAALVSLLQPHTPHQQRAHHGLGLALGIGAARTFLLLSFRPPTSLVRRSTTSQDHPRAPTSAALWLLVSVTSLRRASLAERHRRMIP